MNSGLKWDQFNCVIEPGWTCWTTDWAGKTAGCAGGAAGYMGGTGGTTGGTTGGGWDTGGPASAILIYA